MVLSRCTHYLCSVPTTTATFVPSSIAQLDALVLCDVFRDFSLLNTRQKSFTEHEPKVLPDGSTPTDGPLTVNRTPSTTAPQAMLLYTAALCATGTTAALV